MYLQARRGERPPPTHRLSAMGPFPPGAPLRSAGGTDLRSRQPPRERSLRSLGGRPRSRNPQENVRFAR